MHQLETPSQSYTCSTRAIVVRMGVDVNVASSRYRVGGVDERGLGDSVMGEPE